MPRHRFLLLPLHLLLLIIIASLVLHGSALQCPNGEESAPAELPYCQWYNDDTCCTPETAPDPTAFEDNGDCNEIEEGCRDLFGLLACGPCSPEYASYGNGLGKVKICSDFADKIFDKCRGAEFEVSRGTEVICDAIFERFDESKEFWTNGLFATLYEYTEGEENCFNAANSLHTFASIAISFIIMLQFMF